ncbi:GPO family capsid scaffolding protein [Klebsiella pneumoniae]|uniref:GPO family capsid scaffolding protein n=1 Tax=Klebsiella TaxID=570 RepID=UPI000E2DB423|nr:MULTISPECIES: GPO family capsid scaffolding protein [Klebsiella]HDS7231432.1 GPO family capsid scaffolding protein [Klebsiella pneumoniae subsp. pneumoniae]HEC2094385.1 GPO family capsid scaffolding protein [Klebsiella oxytoca]MCL9975839.1 GPO family capsid scaffolding protein [Klebsiella quasipneumoniae]QLI92912.1 GPO family capsid scaffolding protein [Klebsiella pneumoniae]UXO78712.1 GPO family capsid scaffolding protein [Klebsiella michiganensis]
MARSHLMTDWICIATEGETVDGRNLEAQWLIDMAEAYDAEGIYTALLWPEHERWWGSCGEVLALKCEQVDGQTKLYARLRPEQELLYANQRGQLLFCSIEPTPTLNFRGSGKPYLEGLGVTNQPASVGLDRMRFNAKETGAIYGAFEPLVFRDVAEIDEDDMSNKSTSPKKTLFRSLFNIPDPESKKPEGKPVEKPKKSMFSKSMKFSEEQIESLVEVVEELVEENEALAETLEEIKEKLDEVAEKVDAVEGEVSSDEYKNMRSQIKDVNAKFAKLDKVTTNLPDNNPGDKGPKKYAF